MRRDGCCSGTAGCELAVGHSSRGSRLSSEPLLCDEWQRAGCAANVPARGTAGSAVPIEANEANELLGRAYSPHPGAESDDAAKEDTAPIGETEDIEPFDRAYSPHPGAEGDDAAKEDGGAGSANFDGSRQAALPG